MDADTKRIWINGQLVEITEEVYAAYMKGDRKMRYFESDLKTERFILDGAGRVKEIIPSREDSLDRLMDDNAEQFADQRESVEETVFWRLSVSELYYALKQLDENEYALIMALFFDDKTEREYAEELGVYRNAVHKRKMRILEKLKNFWNKCVQTSQPTANRVRGLFMASVHLDSRINIHQAHSHCYCDEHKPC